MQGKKKKKKMNSNCFAMEQTRRFLALDEANAMDKILRSTKLQLRSEKEARERAVKVERAPKNEVKKRCKMEKRIVLTSLRPPQWDTGNNYVMKICPNAIKVLPPVPPHIKKDGGKRRRVTFKLEETSRC